jgi:hypothetical protein
MVSQMYEMFKKNNDMQIMKATEIEGKSKNQVSLKN